MDNRDQIPEAAEFGLIRAFLAKRKFKQAWINEYTDASKTRGENADMLKAALRDLPKG